jgi:signal peptide peptidase SppA
MKKILSKLIPAKFKSKKVTIPVVRLHGAIMNKSSAFSSNLNLASVAKLLEKAFETNAPAIALSINSPGGSPVQSKFIHDRIRQLANENDKKVHVFVEDVAASGGYMIAVAGDTIVADPSSIVGSIGVISSSFGFPKLMEKIGVERRVYTAGNNKSQLDPFKEENKTDIDHLKNLQLEIHQVFIDMVKTGRGERLSNDENLFTGMFWTGLKGQELGLVDEISDMRSYLKGLYGEKCEMELVEPKKNFFGRTSSNGISALANIGENIIGNATSGAVQAAEEQALWARYGL